jgi:hypothetical protein
LPERLDRRGHLALLTFQGVHRLGEAEHARQRAADRRKGPVHHQFLIPILQQVGVLALRQLQTRVQRHRLDLLPLPGPVDRAHQLEQPEHVADLAPMQVTEPTHLAAILQHDPLPRIGVAEQIQPGLEHVVTQLQHPSPQSALHLVRRAPFIEGLLHKRQNLRKLVEQCLTVVLPDRVVHALHRGLLGLPDLTSRRSLAGRSPVV